MQETVAVDKDELWHELWFRFLELLDQLRQESYFSKCQKSGNIRQFELNEFVTLVDNLDKISVSPIAGAERILRNYFRIYVPLNLGRRGLQVRRKRQFRYS
jgi:hypothetical protein